MTKRNRGAEDRPLTRAEAQAYVDEEYAAGKITLKAWSERTDELGGG